MAHIIERLPNIAIEDPTLTKGDKRRTRRRSIIREFSLNTTAHGLPGIARGSAWYDRTFWSVAFLSFTGIMIFFIIKAIIAYFNYPTIMDTNISSEWPQLFPAFSFCNYSPFRLKVFFDAFQNYSIQYNLTSVNITVESQYNYMSIAKFVIFTLNRNESLMPYFYPISSMLYSCTFNNMPCTKDDFIPFIASKYGACYTFNPKLKNTPNQTLRFANQYGGDGVLSLGLYIHTHQYIPYLVDGFGVLGLVHDNTRLPLIESEGITLAPGRKHKLGYRKKSTYFLSTPYTQCTDKVSFNMQAMFESYNNADYGYSEIICYQLCGQVYAYEQCGCVSPRLWNGRTLYIPKMNRVVYAPLCEIDNPCFPNAIGEILMSKSLMNDHCSDCAEECIIKNLIVQTSALSAPLDWQMNGIKNFVVQNSSIPLPVNWSNTWYEQIQKNYVAIDVVRETSVVENNTQSAAIGTVDVLSNIGGQTGLWIGISFLSIMELIELFYRLIRHEYHVIRERLG